MEMTNQIPRLDKSMRDVLLARARDTPPGPVLPNKATWLRLYNTAKKNSKLDRRGFSITWPEFIELALEAANHCTVTGIPFDCSFQCAEGFGQRRPFAPSVDRINPALGYVKGNVRIVCVITNQALGTWGDGPFWQFIEATAVRLIEEK